VADGLAKVGRVPALSDWISAARPRTLPAALAPVLVGSGAAAALGGFRLIPALLSLAVSLALQIGVNFANDYSDGIRGTDAVRTGPARLTASGLVEPTRVRLLAFVFFGVALIAGLALAAMVSWWLIPLGALCVLAAWFYTGGPKPYGYSGYGEVFVFVFFGLIAVLGTTYVQALRVSASSALAATGIGVLACALLVANNLRDRPTDAVVGKRTLAVLLGDRRTRFLFTGLIAVAFLTQIVLALLQPWCWLGLLAVPLALPPIRAALRGASGRELIPVLVGTARLELVYAVALTGGFLLS
jgi:1,4-dihydroxy-2-naphthoate octaprenyltransferase